MFKVVSELTRAEMTSYCSTLLTYFHRNEYEMELKTSMNNKVIKEEAIRRHNEVAHCYNELSERANMHVKTGMENNKLCDELQSNYNKAVGQNRELTKQIQ